MAQRCSHCQIDYPDDKTTCSVCGEPTWYHNGKHDLKWREEVEKLTKQHKPGQPIPNAQVPVVKKDGRTFVADELMQQAGYTNLTSGSIVQVNGLYYEVYGAVKDHLDAPDSPLGWWIELVQTMDNDFPYPVLTEHEYKELETRRGLRL